MKKQKKSEIKAKPKIKNFIRKIMKRSGRVVPFDQKKILVAVSKAFEATGEGNMRDARKVRDKVIQVLNKRL